MGQISAEEFRRVPLRVHACLSDVPLHDVWALDLQRARAGITLDEFLRAASTINARECGLSLPVRALLKVRFLIGLLGLDREPATGAQEMFAARLTEADRAGSLVPPGTRDGMFRVVYRFRNEQLLEVSNRTAQAAALSALVETPGAYRFYSACTYAASAGSRRCT